MWSSVFGLWSRRAICGQWDSSCDELELRTPVCTLFDGCGLHLLGEFCPVYLLMYSCTKEKAYKINIRPDASSRGKKGAGQAGLWELIAEKIGSSLGERGEAVRTASGEQGLNAVIQKRSNRPCLCGWEDAEGMRLGFILDWLVLCRALKTQMDSP